MGGGVGGYFIDIASLHALHYTALHSITEYYGVIREGNEGLSAPETHTPSICIC